VSSSSYMSQFFQQHPSVMNTLGRLLMKAHLIYLDYPVNPTPRYGYGNPLHGRLLALIEENADSYEQMLSTFLDYSDFLLKIPAHPPSASYRGPYWCNGYIPALDTVSLYCLLATLNPQRYFEIGSGHSTRFARQAITDHGLATRITSIDPHPRSDIDSICDEILRVPLEALDMTKFEELEEGDVLFVDNGHRVFMNNGPTVFFLDALPRVASGVNLGFHDVFLPYDYPPEWERLYYSEQYLLAVFLLFASKRYFVQLPAYHVSKSEELFKILDLLWTSANFIGVETHGASFWLKLRSPLQE